MLLTFVRPADSLFSLQNENAVYRQRLCVCVCVYGFHKHRQNRLGDPLFMSAEKISCSSSPESVGSLIDKHRQR